MNPAVDQWIAVVIGALLILFLVYRVTFRWGKDERNNAINDAEIEMFTVDLGDEAEKLSRLSDAELRAMCQREDLAGAEIDENADRDEMISFLMRGARHQHDKELANAVRIGQAVGSAAI